MATNLYFNNFPTSQITSEQLLVEDLVIEAMQINGMDVYYLPRTTRDEVDYLYGEDTLKEYRSAHAVEMYLENVTGMDGDQDFISKFGLEIKDEVTMLISRLKFRYAVNGLVRPREGDLVFVPLLNNFFEITFVEHEDQQTMFYTLGRGRGGNVYVYALKMKQWVFSNELVLTGNAEIDGQIKDAYPRTKLSLLAGGTGTFVPDEIVYQGASLATANVSATVHNYVSGSELYIYRPTGTFATSTQVKGNTSGAIWTVGSTSDTATMDNAFEDVVDNNRIETEADDIIDFTEHNPFGEA